MQSSTRGSLIAAGSAVLGAVFLIPYQAAVGRGDRADAVVAMLLVAAVFNTVVAAVTGRGRRLGSDDFKLAAVLCVLTVIGNVAVAASLPSIGAGMTSVVLKAQVILTPCLAWIVWRERLPASIFIGIAFASVGFLMMRGSDLSPTAFPWWGLAAAGAFAAMQIATRHWVHRIHLAGVNALRLWGAVAALLLWPKSMGGASLSHDLWLWVWAGAAGILGPGISRLGLMTALRHITPSLAALIALVGPVFAFALGYAVFDEVPAATGAAGAVLILIGVAYPGFAGLRKRDKARLSDHG